MNKFIFSFAVLVFSQMSLAIGETDRVAEIKKEIIEIAKQNTTNEADFAVIRMKLDALVAEIQTLSKPVNVETINQYSPGSWKQIWSDERNMDVSGGPQRDLNQIYQYLNPNGWAFNFGVRKLPNGQEVTFALKVQGTIVGNEQKTEILAAYLRLTPLQSSESIQEISQQIYDGTSVDFVKREVGQFPNGPIGAVGILSFKYLDEDIKIGTTNSVFTGESVLFVLQRM